MKKSNEMCKLAYECEDIDCLKAHRKAEFEHVPKTDGMCKFGKECRTKDCKFPHTEKELEIKKEFMVSRMC